MPKLDAIYLYKPLETENEDWTWTYYRVRGGHHDGDSVEVSRVKFPSFEDVAGENGLGDITATPGVVGYIGVPEHLQTLMQEQWKVDHSKSVLIGLLDVH